MTDESQKQDAEFAALESEIVTEQSPEKLAQMQQRENAPESAEVLQPVLEMGFAILAPNWQIQQEETKQLARAYADLLDKYFPDGLGDYGVEINAIMITGAIVLPRLRVPRKVEQKATEAGQGGENAQAE